MELGSLSVGCATSCVLQSSGEKGELDEVGVKSGGREPRVTARFRTLF